MIHQLGYSMCMFVAFDFLLIAFECRQSVGGGNGLAHDPHIPCLEFYIQPAKVLSRYIQLLYRTTTGNELNEQSAKILCAATRSIIFSIDNLDIFQLNILTVYLI